MISPPVLRASRLDGAQPVLPLQRRVPQGHHVPIKEHRRACFEGGDRSGCVGVVRELAAEGVAVLSASLGFALDTGLIRVDDVGRHPRASRRTSKATVAADLCVSQGFLPQVGVARTQKSERVRSLPRTGPG